jgi:hypothetical protein
VGVPVNEADSAGLILTCPLASTSVIAEYSAIPASSAPIIVPVSASAGADAGVYSLTEETVAVSEV